MNTAGHWFCFCCQCHGCQTIKEFLERRRSYCLICQFQDRFRLCELHQVKRDLQKPKSYSSKRLEHVWNVKKQIASEEDFWERDIPYIVLDNGVVYVYFNKLK